MKPTDPPDDATAEGRTLISDKIPSDALVSLPLPRGTVSVTPEATADFQLAETLGEGGMGQVVSATQRALLRPVALKFSRDEAGRQALLREAIATGRLEHPNIVPVHLLATNDDGAPFFAMKRVEGTPWSSVITTRPLVENLEVLRHVCDALAFAHDRHIVHRDVKPSNVMLGRFGEVYLVDWALAVSLRPDAVLPMPAADSLAGTPAYMAPEMVIDPAAIDTRTDVYLLGAVLYEVLTGRAPHRAPTTEEAINAAARGDAPMFDASVPEELALICRRAMAKMKGDRFAGVTAFKQALTDYLRHQEASALYQTAARQLVELEARLASDGGSDAVHALFSECRFTFEQVRRLWPEFEGAKTRLRQTLLAMARAELRRDRLAAARLLLSQLEAPAPAELLAQLELAEAEERNREHRLHALERSAKESSVDAASSEKALYSRGLGVSLFLVGAALQTIETLKPGTLQTWMGVPYALVLLLNTIAYFAVLKRAPDFNLRQRRIVTALIVNAAAGTLMWLVAWGDGLTLLTALRCYLVINAVTWAIPGVIDEPRALWVSGAVSLALGASYLVPSLTILFGGLFGGIGLLILGALLARVSSTAR